MYTQCFSFVEKEDDADISSYMEDFDKVISSHAGQIKFVTHSIAVVGSAKHHYYTLFLEDKPKMPTKMEVY